MRVFLENNQVIFSSSEDVFEVAVGVFLKRMREGETDMGSQCVSMSIHILTQRKGKEEAGYLFILNNHSSAFWMEASAN